MVPPLADAIGDRWRFGRHLEALAKGLAEPLQHGGGQAADGGVQLADGGRIEVRIVEEGGRVSVDVADNGPGLPKEDRNRLTEPYVTTREKGTGLGLAIVKRICEEHGGELKLADAETLGGAKICLIFPLKSQQPSTASAKGKDAPASRPATVPANE